MNRKSASQKFSRPPPNQEKNFQINSASYNKKKTPAYVEDIASSLQFSFKSNNNKIVPECGGKNCNNTWNIHLFSLIFHLTYFCDVTT